ncbi:MAG: DNA repair protein RadC [Deltaproteobacteria bacterium]|nr:MAG: DNA repair protein RadC [Deltaproteobacteria bacterium]
MTAFFEAPPSLPNPQMSSSLPLPTTRSRPPAPPPQDLEHLSVRTMQQLSEDELLALLLRTSSRVGGTPLEQARTLRREFGSLRELERSGVLELTQTPGITAAKASAIHAALELGRRLVEQPIQRGQSFTSSRMVFEAFAPRLSGYEQETFWLLLLDQKNRVLKQHRIAQGSINRCPLTPQDVFAPALREKAVRLLLIHNHPSGNPEPSRDDRTLTERLQQMAQLLGMEVIDHIVLGDQDYVSFADRGWL